MRTASTLLGLGALAAISAAPAQAQSIHDYLPANSAVVVTVPDLAGSIERFKSMPMAKMWREEEVQDFMADLMDFAETQFEQWMEQGKQMHQNGTLPVDPEKLMKLRVNGGTFALTEFSMEMGDFGQPIPNIGIVAQVDFGASAKDWFQLINMGVGMMAAQAGDNMVRSDTKLSGYDVITLAPQEEDIPLSLNMAFVGNSLVFHTQTESLAILLKAMAENTPVLAASEDYKRSFDQVQIQTPEMVGFIRIKPFTDMLVQGMSIAAEQGMPVSAEGIERAIDALGLNSIKAMAMASAYQDGESITRGYTLCPAPERKGLLAGTTKNLDLDFLRWVPKDAVSVTATTMDMMSIYDGLVAGLNAYDENFAKMAMGRLGEMEEQLGMSLKDDFFGAFGDQFVTWSMPMVALGSPPEMAFLIKVKDQDRILGTMKKLTAMSDGAVELQEVNRRGIKAHQVRVNLDMGPGMMMNPFDMFVPTFSFKDGYMVVGLSAGDVKRVFDRMDREDDPTGDIRGNKEFAPMMGRIPAGVTSVSFTDWKANFEGLYQMITGVLAFVPMDDSIPVDLALLPDSMTLTQHLKGSLSYTVTDGNGFHTVTHSPFGPEVLIGGGFMIGAAIGVAAAMGELR